MKPHLCIAPQCPSTCEGCNYAVAPEDTPRQLIARLLCEFAVTHDRQPFADGANALVDRARAYLRDPGPRLWIVEYGAVGLPHGNPCRLTTFELHEHEGEARAAAEASEFKSRMFMVVVPPDGVSLGPADYPECSGDPSSCPENEGHGCCKTATGVPVGSAPSLRRALEVARPYVEEATRRMYDGTGGEAIRREAARRLAEIDAALGAGGNDGR